MLCARWHERWASGVSLARAFKFWIGIANHSIWIQLKCKIQPSSHHWLVVRQHFIQDTFAPNLSLVFQQRLLRFSLKGTLLHLCLCSSLHFWPLGFEAFLIDAPMMSMAGNVFGRELGVSRKGLTTVVLSGLLTAWLVEEEGVWMETVARSTWGAWKLRIVVGSLAELLFPIASCAGTKPSDLGWEPGNIKL